jgi:hypothetical protein
MNKRTVYTLKKPVIIDEAQRVSVLIGIAVPHLVPARLVQQSE